MTPGQAISQALSGGVGDVVLCVSAIAVMIGLLVLWDYIKDATSFSRHPGEYDEFYKRTGFRHDNDPRK